MKAKHSKTVLIIGKVL